MNKCEYRDDEGNVIAVFPDGIHELDPCEYVEVQRLRNVTISILQCMKCGHIEITWQRQEDTEDV